MLARRCCRMGHGSCRCRGWKGLRGFSAVSMLIVEEASRLPDAAYFALLPSLAVLDGDLILLSTPMGRRGFFYREATEGVSAADTLVHTGPVTECSRIT